MAGLIRGLLLVSGCSSVTQVSRLETLALLWPTHPTARIPDWLLDHLLRPDVHAYAMLADGNTYVSPMTGEKMQSLILLPDRNTRSLVKQYTDEARRWSVLGDCKC
jgi:hypothetical protein